MQEYIDKIGYGNKDISGGHDHLLARLFSADFRWSRVDLLNKLYSGQLPFSAANTAILQKNLISPDGGTKLMGKPAPASVKSGFQGGSSAVSPGRPVLCLRHEHRSRETAPTAAKRR